VPPPGAGHPGNGGEVGEAKTGPIASCLSPRMRGVTQSVDRLVMEAPFTSESIERIDVIGWCLHQPRQFPGEEMV
jgi:hypothetical protein